MSQAGATAVANPRWDRPSYPGDDALSRRDQTLVDRARDAGLSRDQIVEWWPILDALGIKAASVGIEHRLRYDDLDRWRGTVLGVGSSVLGEEYLRNRFALIRIATDEEWTPGFLRAVKETAPDGCAVWAWAQIWTRFMPASLAGAYAAAGFSLPEAVRLHLSGRDPDEQTLETMAALRA